MQRIYGAGGGPDPRDWPPEHSKPDPDPYTTRDPEDNPYQPGDYVAVLCYSADCPICSPYADLGAVPYGSIPDPPFHQHCQCELVDASKGQGRVAVPKGELLALPSIPKGYHWAGEPMHTGPAFPGEK